MLGALRLILGLRLGVGVRDRLGVLIDGLDGLGVNDLLRLKDGLDGRVGADLELIDGLDLRVAIDGPDRPGLMEGLVLPGLMDGLGRLGLIERLELDPDDPRLLLMRLSMELRLELLDLGATDELRRLEIEELLRLLPVELRLLGALELDVDWLRARLDELELDRDLRRLSASERALEADFPSTDDAINRATTNKIATAAARELFFLPMTHIAMLLSPAVLLSASLTPQPAYRRHPAPAATSRHITISSQIPGLLP